MAITVLAWTVYRDKRALEKVRYKQMADKNLVSDPLLSPSLGNIGATVAPPETIRTSEVVFNRASPSVVTVKIYGGENMRLMGQGSGVAVGIGTVVTNRHVVEKAGEIRVFDNGRAYPATVKYADKEYDLCALEVLGLTAPPTEMVYVGSIRVGQRVYAIGSPQGLELSISDGVVSSIRPYGIFPVIQTNASISKGSSGGGLFDTEGRLVGITMSSSIDGQNINFALPADLISQLPVRTADIRTLKPIVPVRRADDIKNSSIINELQEGKNAISVIEAELKSMEEEINRYTFTMKELKRSMDGFLASRNTKAYNDMVPQHNQLVNQRKELANRYAQKRQEYVGLVESHNQLLEQYQSQLRLQ